jgi:hypothetical protein
MPIIYKNISGITQKQIDSDDCSFMKKYSRKESTQSGDV